MQKNKYFNLQPMIIVALLVAINIILSRFSVMIPLFGYPSVRFSVTGIPIFLAGALFGPVLGACAGFISDILNFALSSSGPYYPGFTLNAVISGAIPGFIFMKLRQSGVKYSFNKMNIGMALFTFVGAAIYINFIGIHELQNRTTILSVPTNVWMTFFVLLLILALMVIFRVIQKRYDQNKLYFSIDTIIFISMVQYIVINLILTPFWLNQLYGIPVSASIFIRLFKAVVDVPLQAFLIYMVIHALPITLLGGKQCKIQ